MQSPTLDFVGQRLTSWYKSEKRDLPWRETTNPYYIWISEIILQQTRVVQGLDYYLRFVKTFPSISKLAEASEDEVLKLWQGLGYYSRARNLHFAAKTIVEKYNGLFPTKHEDIISLKGIGEYTAAAISSFAFNLPYATVDGNVFRFLSRLFGVSTPIDTTKGKKEFTELANTLLPKDNPGLFNQAIMEFGALQCVPASPNCVECCFNDKCYAYNQHKVNNYPIKQGKVKTKDRFFNYLDIRSDTTIFLHKRNENDIWKGLYELPLIETNEKIDLLQLQEEDSFKFLFENIQIKSIQPVNIEFKHILSHQKIYARFYQIRVTNNSVLSHKFVEIQDTELSKFPISRLVDKYFSSI